MTYFGCLVIVEDVYLLLIHFIARQVLVFCYYYLFPVTYLVILAIITSEILGMGENISCYLGKIRKGMK